MALILPVLGKTPQNGENCWFAQNATIVGDVTMGKDCTVWFNAVIRGDVNSIIMGDRVNIQDGAVIHCTYQKSKTIIGNNVSIAHNAVVHGCTIEDEVLVGMGAIIMDGAIIGKKLYHSCRCDSNTKYGCASRKYLCRKSSEIFEDRNARTRRSFHANC